MRKLFAFTSLAALAVGGAIAFTTLSAAQMDQQTVASEGEMAAAELSREITIWRSPGCGCCDAYADYLKANGYQVAVVDD
ncbi:MAG: metal-binding protein, partial [Alphaproteobacteria bacterium]